MGWEPEGTTGESEPQIKLSVVQTSLASRDTQADCSTFT
jgi:hypothetical protein